MFMKRSKIGFLAILAIAAMSFTVVAKTSSGKLGMSADTFGCYTSVSVRGSNYTGFQTPGSGYTNPEPVSVSSVTAESGPINTSTCTQLTAFCCYNVDLTTNTIEDVYYKP
jgi:hypothetical protein